MKTVLASGHFDPFHPGHVNYLTTARTYGDQLVVAVDSDEALSRKHLPVLCGEDRAALVRQLTMVTQVILSRGVDVSDVIESVKPDIYVVGPDYRDPGKISEKPVCDRMGVPVIPVHGLTKDGSGSIIAKAKMVYSNRPTTVSAILLRGGLPMVCTRKAEDGRGRTDLIGGFVEPGESLEQALAREVEEECGASVTNVRWLGSWPGRYSDGRTLLATYFVCESRTPLRKTSEASHFRTVSSVPDDMFMQCDALALHYFLSGKTL